MGIAQDLNAKTLELRKQRSDIAGGFQLVQGFAQATAKERGLKGGDATVNDEDALRAIQKGIKTCRDTLEVSGPANATDGVVERTQRELYALEALLPKMASDDEMEASVTDFLARNPDLALSKGVMGAIMKHLMDTFGTALDRGRASQIAKSATAQLNA